VKGNSVKYAESFYNEQFTLASQALEACVRQNTSCATLLDSKASNATTLSYKNKEFEPA
jgi:hypothetical protein